MQVKTPRFYVDIFSYLKTIGLVQSEDSTFNIGLNPTEQKSREIDRAADDFSYYHYILNEPIDDARIANPNHNKFVVGFLGHNFKSLNIQPRVKINLNNDTYSYGTDGNYKEIINGDGKVDTVPEYDGFTLYETNYSFGDFNRFTMRLGNTNQAVNGIAKLGSLFVGTYYDMPHSPDLSLKLSYEYDGIKTQQTKGGATLSNSLYSKPADWGDYGCWQLGNQKNLRSGRRVWDLSFSYLSDSDIMPNLGVQNYEEGAVTADILDSTDFFSQVWNKTIGGHLPFIFQPDNTNNNPDQFAICRFDQSSLQVTQQAPFLYQISLKIRESW